MIAHSPAPFFRPLRKLRLRFLCHWQREAAFPLAQGRLAGRRGRRDVQRGRQGAAGVPEFSGFWLDFAGLECYTRYVRNSKRVFRVFLVSLHGKCRFPGDKTESGSVEGYRERPRWPRRRRGMQQTLRQKDRIRTTLRKVRSTPHTKGATGSRRAAEGNLSGKDGGKKIRGIFLSLFLCLGKESHGVFPLRGRRHGTAGCRGRQPLQRRTQRRRGTAGDRRSPLRRRKKIWMQRRGAPCR